MDILAINVGSSSVRLASYRISGGRSEAIGRMRVEPASASGLAPYLDTLRISRPDRIVHRIVHGGPRLVAPCEIDDVVEDEIARMTKWAPLHNRNAGAWITQSRREFPSAMQIGVFDTAFFATLPEVASTYALPRELCLRFGIRRYGFHGLAHRGMWDAWQRATGRSGRGKLVTFQLGGGCSAAAIRDGRPVDTSMGMTPQEGLVMGTRAGDLDSGVVSYLATGLDVNPATLVDVLNRRSGLLGISGVSAEPRELLESGAPDSKLAMDVYCHRARKYLGAYLAVLGGADAIVFGGGVGEHEAPVRARICEGASFCGLRLDRSANEGRRCGVGPVRVSAQDSAIEVWVVPVDEEALMATDAAAVERGQQ